MSWGDFGYISQLFGWDRSKFNPNHDPDNGEFSSGGGSGGSSSGRPSKPLPAPGGDTHTWFHGTSNQAITMRGNQVYLTDNEDEAYQYARDVHRGGKPLGNQKRVLNVKVKPGKTLDLAAKLDTAMARGDDPDAVLTREFARARKAGYRYVYYNHPSNLPKGDTQRVLVSLYPKEDLHVL